MKMKKRAEARFYQHVKVFARLILTLTSCLRLLLTLNRRLFVVLSLTNLSDNAVLCT